MAKRQLNEKKTEAIVRKKLIEKGYFKSKEFTIAEQKSDDAKIQKLLQNASKRGLGQGRPEFIITSNKINDLIIVIECKADPTKHQSETLDKYSDYAVDGVLLYASYLSKEYDVLAIAVSGEAEEELKISHFLFLKNDNNYKRLSGEEILSFENYYNTYKTDPIKFNKDYQSLLEYSKELNDLLQINKIKESHRSLLISGILIALKNKAFLKGYKGHNTAKELAIALVNTIGNQLTNAKLPIAKVENLKVAFSFIHTHAILSKNKKFIEDLITQIDAHVNSFMKTYQYYDTIGQFYIEFLRYTNNDKGLGIVLTPPHITELFVELANINKDSIVLDNCCGTGGFLISALKKMVNDANNNEDKIDSIKTHQLIGIEFQDDIFALAVSNMFLHGDGKTNIFQGDCFKLKKAISKKFKPTVGFLNPPYSLAGENVTEFDFILNNLSMLEKNGTCIAIVPMSCALANKGNELELKKKLMQSHTLEAVMSMPNDLFAASKAGPVTCIMIFTAHVPHSKGIKTWFGYWKNDEFVKKKNLGRIDYYNRWEEIRNNWVNGYKNKEEVTGFSVKREVTAIDEWCAEAYIESNYSTLNDNKFSDIIKEYVVYQFSNNLIDAVSNTPVNVSQEILDMSNWKDFSLKDIFDPSFEKGKCDNASNLLDDGNEIAYVGAKKNDNGIVNKVKKIDALVTRGNCIAFIGDGQGSVGYTLYQPVDFIGTSNLKIGRMRGLNVYRALFLVTVLDLERFKYSFGRKYGVEQILTTKIKLPTDNKGNPDWLFMENYIKSLPYSSNLEIICNL